VEPTTPCATKTSKEEEPFRKQVISGRRILVVRWSSGNSSKSISLASSSQVSTPHGGGSTTNFTMAGVDPTIRLLEFSGEGSKDPEKHLFICENIWIAKQIKDEDTKVAQLAIKFRDCALDWYMGLAVNIPQGTPTTITDAKKTLINEFKRPSSEDQFMNEMIEIKQNPGELVWEVDQKFKRLKGKLKYPITTMKNRHLFVNSLFPHLKYPLR
jgi:hypothetical protein